MNSSIDFEVIKDISLPGRGRPKSAILDEKGRNIRQLEAVKKWKQAHKENVYLSNKKSDKKRRDHLKQCEMIVLILKELIKINKVQLPHEVKELIDKNIRHEKE
jgi:hypothetical protein